MINWQWWLSCLFQLSLDCLSLVIPARIRELIEAYITITRKRFSFELAAFLLNNFRINVIDSGLIGRFNKKELRSYVLLFVTPKRDPKQLQKGGVPAAPSGTATLLRLSASYRFNPKQRLATTAFRSSQLPSLDGRCVQGPGTYSPRHCWCAITSDSNFMQASCSLQSELRRTFCDWLVIADWQHFVYAIVARV